MYEESDGFNDFLKLIIDMGHLDQPALGITKQVIDKGKESLTEKQEYVFQKDVLDYYTVERCKLCSDEIPWQEMYDAATEHGMCSWCVNLCLKEN